MSNEWFLIQILYSHFQPEDKYLCLTTAILSNNTGIELSHKIPAVMSNSHLRLMNNLSSEKALRSDWWSGSCGYHGRQELPKHPRIQSWQVSPRAVGRFLFYKHHVCYLVDYAGAFCAELMNFCSRINLECQNSSLLPSVLSREAVLDVQAYVEPLADQGWLAHVLNWDWLKTPVETVTGT